MRRGNWKAVVILLLAVIGTAWASTKMRDLIITNSSGSFYALFVTTNATEDAACQSYSSTASSGCTVQVDGKILQWVQGANLNLTGLSGCGTGGSPASAPAPYSGTCDQSYITLTWPVTFTSGCLAPYVIDTNATVDSEVSGATHMAGEWIIIGTPSTTSIEIQRAVYYANAGTRSDLTNYNGHPTAYCIGN